MLNRVILAAVFGIIAYLVCIFVGGLLLTVNVPIAVTLGAFLKTFATLISIIAFLYYAFTN